MCGPVGGAAVNSRAISSSDKVIGDAQAQCRVGTAVSRRAGTCPVVGR